MVRYKQQSLIPDTTADKAINADKKLNAVADKAIDANKERDAVASK